MLKSGKIRTYTLTFYPEMLAFGVDLQEGFTTDHVLLKCKFFEKSETVNFVNIHLKLVRGPEIICETWKDNEQESPSAWAQETYRPPCSKSGGGGWYLPWPGGTYFGQEGTYFQGGHGTGKTGNLDVHFSRQGKHREFTKNMILHREFKSWKHRKSQGKHREFWLDWSVATLTLAGGYLPMLGSTYCGWGIPTLARGY